MTWRTSSPELVAVRVDVEEVVVLADGLELVERVAERPVVPQAGVQERARVLLDRGLGQRRLAAVVADVPAVEVEREPGHRDVVADVRRSSSVLLVGLDRDLLDELRVDPADADRGDEPDRDRQPERPHHPGERAADEERRGDRRQPGQHVVGEELRVRVGVADAGRDAPGAVDELELVELVADRDRHEDQAAPARRGGPGPAC